MGPLTTAASAKATQQGEPRDAATKLARQRLSVLELAAGVAAVGLVGVDRRPVAPDQCIGGGAVADTGAGEDGAADQVGEPAWNREPVFGMIGVQSGPAAEGQPMNRSEISGARWPRASDTACAPPEPVLGPAKPDPGTR